MASMTSRASACACVLLCAVILSGGTHEQRTQSTRTFVVLRWVASEWRSWPKWALAIFHSIYTRRWIAFVWLSVRPCSSFVLRISPVHYIVALTTCLCAPLWRPAAPNVFRKKEAQEMRIRNHSIHTLFIHNAYIHIYGCMGSNAFSEIVPKLKLCEIIGTARRSS